MHFFLFFLLLAASSLNAVTSEWIDAPYYTYSQQNYNLLAPLSSVFSITKESLQKWDLVIQDLLKKYLRPSDSPYRVYAYLYAAQRDFIFLSYNKFQKYAGSIDPISFSMARLFFPEFTLPPFFETDLYSDTLAKIIFQKYQKRFNEEEAIISKEEIYIFNMSAWTGHQIEFGESIQFWKHWQIPYLGNKLMPSTSQNSLSKKKFKASKTKPNPLPFRPFPLWVKPIAKPSIDIDWIQVTNQYLFTHPIPLEKVVLIRSLLSMAISDTLIVNFQSKYNRKTKEFYFEDFSFFTRPPQHADYPSAHVAIATTASELLTHFFPEQKAKWEQLSEE